jgi:drug/metabolite transporter (DMT)-like permease
VGLLICGSILTSERGLDGWLLSPICWAFVLTAGVCNMIGFYFQIESLRRLFVLKQTIVANAQTLLLTLLGIFAYREPLTWIVAVGLVLVFVAVWLAGAEKQNA